ncbi:putative nonsense-mediated mrna decay protein [Eutypa lata UCREL1]|uniref:Putative nonsense-mediated mrna decay protein n=1 Tax=Eutypa lata (strain UCR-EL1) TaxID=1287681 RepID=M7SV91_EUTLA|nr:putative nonsense-mediated mrna decay protein [Eutypa lata UCREL1]
MTSASTSRKVNANSNGVSQDNVGQPPNEGSKTGKTKSPPTGKKVVIRRLPPGMTAEEAWTILGDQWKDGNGKVDWSQFHTGSISQESVATPIIAK